MIFRLIIERERLLKELDDDNIFCELADDLSLRGTSKYNRIVRQILIPHANFMNEGLNCLEDETIYYAIQFNEHMLIQFFSDARMKMKRLRKKYRMCFEVQKKWEISEFRKIYIKHFGRINDWHFYGGRKLFDYQIQSSFLNKFMLRK